MSEGDVALSVQNLSVAFESRQGLLRAVRGVSFDVAAGETLGIVGESGSGKSVSCLAAMGLLPDKSTQIDGSIKLAGQELLGLSEKRLQKVRGKQLAMIFQDPMTSLNPFLRVGKQLSEVLEVHENASRREARKRSIEMLERVGIADAPARYLHFPHQFSGGMRQRIMIAMALLCRPRVLIADEPTTALDVTIQAQILRLIKELAADLKTAVVFITHDLGVIAGVADKVSVMYAGRVVESAQTERLFKAPEHPYTQGLLQSVPRLHEDGALVAIPGHPPTLAQLPSGCAFHPRCPLAIEACRMHDPAPQKVVEGHQVRCPQAKAFREKEHPLAKSDRARSFTPRAPIPTLDTADLEQEVASAAEPPTGQELASPAAVERVTHSLDSEAARAGTMPGAPSMPPRPAQIDPEASGPVATERVAISDDELKEALEQSEAKEASDEEPAGKDSAKERGNG